MLLCSDTYATFSFPSPKGTCFDPCSNEKAGSGISCGYPTLAEEMSRCKRGTLVLLPSRSGICSSGAPLREIQIKEERKMGSQTFPPIRKQAKILPLMAESPNIYFRIYFIKAFNILSFKQPKTLLFLVNYTKAWVLC